MYDFPYAIISAFIYLIPVWIKGVSNASMMSRWKKRVLIDMMTLVALFYVMIAALQPNNHFLSKLLGCIVYVIYLSAVIISSNRCWPKYN
jgi:divalent metal cation (Fe/Co/Zn/Cd) transporter